MLEKMRQDNYRRWTRFMLANSLELTPLERDVCLTVCIQTWGPSGSQRRILWKALNRIHPEACGKWGRPG
ncbi:hypothetical protein [Sphingomonas parapaucimobilis]